MVVAAVGIGKLWIRADVFNTSITGFLIFDATIVSDATVQITICIIPKDAVNDVRIGSLPGTNTVPVISYCQIGKLWGRRTEEDGSSVSSVAAGNDEIPQNTI